MIVYESDGYTFGEWNVFVRRDYYRPDSIEVYLRRYVDGGSEYIESDDGKLTSHFFKEGHAPVKEDGGPLDPTFRMTDKMFQAIFEALWEFGLRPKSRRFEQETDLMKAHLEDMRRIAFKFLEGRENA